MGIVMQLATPLAAEAPAGAPFERRAPALASRSAAAASAFAAALPTRSEARIAVLTGDPLLAFAVTALATSHFPAATVIRPELDDIRAARHLDSRPHALIILDDALIAELGDDAVVSWMRPFRSARVLLMSRTPDAPKLDWRLNVIPVPRDITPRGLAETIARHLRRFDNAGDDRRQRAQEIDRLTATQWRVIGYLGSGHSNKEIAYRMGISEATVKAHVGAAIARLGLTNRTEVALFAQRLALGSRWSASAAGVDAPA